MKKYIFLVLPLLCSCLKGFHQNTPKAGETWQLQSKSWSDSVNGNGSETPDPSAKVDLVLYLDSTYITELNGVTVSQGTYTLFTSVPMILQLNEFLPTGIFVPDSTAAFTAPNGETEYIPNYFIMFYGAANTLTLTGQPSTGGYVTYNFSFAGL